MSQNDFGLKDLANEQKKESDIPKVLTDLNRLIDEKKTVDIEMGARNNEFQDSIKRLDVYLFLDDPKKNIYSLMNELKEEMSDPFNQDHPLVPLMLQFLETVKTFRKEYMRYTTFLLEVHKKNDIVIRGLFEAYRQLKVEKDRKIQELNQRVTAPNAKIPTNQPLSSKPQLTTQEMDVIRLYTVNGWGMQKTGRKLGVSESKVKEILIKNNIDIRAPGLPTVDK